MAKVKINHHKFWVAFIAVTVMALLTTTSAHADFIYVGSGNNTIVKFDSSGNRSTFASVSSVNVLAFDSSGNLYVSEPEGNSGTIVKFDSSGNRSTFASLLYYSVGLAFDGSGNLYASYNRPNYAGAGIYKVDPSGNVSLFASGLTGAGDLEFDSNGNLYTSEALPWAPKIWKFDPSGNGSIFASWVGYPHQPAGLAFDSSGNLYVALQVSGTIEKFDSSGNRSIFASGLTYPTDLEFDSGGNLYLIEGTMGMIVKFDSSGNRSIFASGLSPSGMAMIPEVPPVPVTIDIKPGNVPVAILSSATFDATTVDRSTVEFAGAPPLPNYCSQLGEIPEDVDGDGLLDIVFYFKTSDLNLPPDDTEACLTGRTFSGQEFKGCESICRLGSVIGDLNNDCKMDFKDFAIFASYWLKCTDPNCQ